MPKSYRSEKRLKQDAKKLSKETGLTQSKALDQIARDHGFSSWIDLSRATHEGRLEYNVTPQQAELFPVDKIHSDNSNAVDDLSVREHENKIELTSRGIDFSLFEPTSTGLKKSILDATQTVRSLFELNDFHVFELQGQGEEHKVKKQAYLLSPEEIIETKVSLYRPNTKKGDPRMWFSKLARISQAGDKVAIIVYQNSLYLINISNVNLKSVLADEDAALSKFINEYKSTADSVAVELLNKLKKIAAKGPLKSIMNGSTAIGMTIEHALGIVANSSKDPDYKGIEIKAGRGFNRTRTNLFAQVADWKISPLKSSREILNEFGYERGDDFKLYCTVSAIKTNSQGLKFERREADALLVEIQQDYGDVAVWPDKLLKARLLEKHAETFWISAESIDINGVEHFQLKSVTHTKSPLQNQLLPLIESGHITMDHLIKRKAGVKPRVSEKGPLFKINKKDLPLLFPSPNNYSLTN